MVVVEADVIHGHALQFHIICVCFLGLISCMAAPLVPCRDPRILWIASAPDTAFKLRDKCKDTGKVFKDRLCNLNHAALTPDIARELETNGFALQDISPDHILGVCLVGPDFAYDALRSLSPAQAMQHDFFRSLHTPDCSLHGLLVFFLSSIASFSQAICQCNV